MSVSALPIDVVAEPATQRTKPLTAGRLLHWVLQDLASLQLTVILFLLGILVIWVGTTAQADPAIWEVVDQYFRAFFMEFPCKYVFAAQFFPVFLHDIPGKF